MPTTIKKSEEIREILARACERREILILATPYLRFESQFLGLQGDELQVLATMNREEATYGLRMAGITLRFPHELGFYEGNVQMVGLGIQDNRRVLRLALPRVLQENDQRVAYRVDRVGRVQVTCATQKAELLVTTLVDISITGARLHLQRDVKPGEIAPGDSLQIEVPLDPPLAFSTHASVRHAQNRTVGVEFTPRLPPKVLDPLSKWVFQKREEGRERAAQRLEQKRQEPGGVLGGNLPSQGILFISSDEALHARLRDVLEGLPPVVCIPPGIQELKEALAFRPVLAILHVGGTGLDSRKRFKALADACLHRGVPVLLLGTAIEGALLFEFCRAWGGASAMVWEESRAPFFLRLAQGIIRRHGAGGESPLAPVEESR